MSSGLQADALHRPVFTSATGQAVIPCSFCSKGACGTRWLKGRFRDPPASQASSPLPFESQRRTSNGPAFASEVAQAEPGPRKQPFACVPHADGFVGLLDVPGMAACVSVPPFVRADARTFTRAVRSLRRGPPRPPPGQEILKTSGAGKLRGPPRPVPRRVTIAARSVSVRDETNDNCPGRNIYEKTGPMERKV